MARALLLLLLLACAWLGPRPAWCQEAPQTPDWRMTLKTIRNGVHKIDMYLNAALDLLGGEDGLCQYKCSDGEAGGGAGGRRRSLPSRRAARFRRPGPLRPAGAARAGGWRQRSRRSRQPLPGPRGAEATSVPAWRRLPRRPRLPQRGARPAMLQTRGFLPGFSAALRERPESGGSRGSSGSLGWLGLPRRAGWDCLLGREMGLVVAP